MYYIYSPIGSGQIIPARHAAPGLPSHGDMLTFPCNKKETAVHAHTPPPKHRRQPSLHPVAPRKLSLSHIRSGRYGIPAGALPRAVPANLDSRPIACPDQSLLPEAVFVSTKQCDFSPQEHPLSLSLTPPVYFLSPNYGRPPRPWPTTRKPPTAMATVTATARSRTVTRAARRTAAAAAWMARRSAGVGGSGSASRLSTPQTRECVRSMRP